MKITIYSRDERGLKTFNLIKGKYPNNEITFFYDKKNKMINDQIFSQDIKPLFIDSDLCLILDNDIEKLLTSKNVTMDVPYTFNTLNLEIKNNSKGVHIIKEILTSLNIETCRVEL